MIEPIRDIETEMVEVVRSKCPIAPLFYEKDFEYGKKCGNCDFLFEPHRCGWDEYETKLVRKTSCTDDDDELYGGMPSTDYSRYISCMRCGGEIVFSNGFSWFEFSDKECCPNCGTPHMYLGGGTDGLVFAVPKDL